MPIHRGHDAIDHFRRNGDCNANGQQSRRYAGEHGEFKSHQKVCPTLKNTLKWLRVLGIEDRYWSHLLTVVGLLVRERRRIQIVSEIEAHRTHRSLVSHPNARSASRTCSCSRTAPRWPAAGKHRGPSGDQRSRLWKRSCPLVKTFPASWKITKLMLSWKKGRVGGGIRNSMLLMSTAVPPRGKPVIGSRGPA